MNKEQALEWSRELDVVELGQQRLQRKAGFEAREMRPGAEVFTFAERQMFVGIAPHIEFVNASGPCKDYERDCPISEEVKLRQSINLSRTFPLLYFATL